MQERDFHGTEGTDYPVSDYVFKNIDDYSRLLPKPEYDGKVGEYFSIDEFRHILGELLSKVKEIKSEEMVECDYYKVYKKVELDGEPVGFVLKIFKLESNEAFSKVIDEQETIEQYCPNVVLPTTFLQTELNGQMRKISIQREIDGITIGEYIKQNGQLTPELREQIQEMVDGITKLADKESIGIDQKTLDPQRDNVLIDPKVNRFWIVDTNHNYHLSIEDKAQYYKMIDYLENYIGDYI